MKRYLLNRMNLMVLVMMAIAYSTANAQLKEKSRYLVKDIYIADPSAHVFNGKIYVYPSHDVEAGIAENDNGEARFAPMFHTGSIGGWRRKL